MARTGTLAVEGLNIFSREAGKPGNPKLVLPHGFPASSHQYRNLIPALTDRFHVLAMDYPGFGNSDMPGPTQYFYTFDKSLRSSFVFPRRALLQSTQNVICTEVTVL